jgi:hypothetical protein
MSSPPFEKTLSRYVKIDKWIFEVKAVRAIRVDDFGEPYSAIANFTLNGDSAYIDGLLTREDDDFTREDHQTFEKAAQQLAVKSVSFDRFKQNRRVSDTVKVTPLNHSRTELKLVE